MIFSCGVPQDLAYIWLRLFASCFCSLFTSTPPYDLLSFNRPTILNAELFPCLPLLSPSLYLIPLLSVLFSLFHLPLLPCNLYLFPSPTPPSPPSLPLCLFTGLKRGVCSQINHFPDDADYDQDAAEYLLREWHTQTRTRSSQ